MEKGPTDSISRIYENIHTDPKFEKKPTKIEVDYQAGQEEALATALDTFAIPESLIENREAFLRWFEPRFFKLTADGGESGEGIEEFNKAIKEAAEILSEHKYLLAPKIGTELTLAPSVKKTAEKGMKNVEEIIAFIKKVAVPNDPLNAKKFFSPDRKSTAGAQKLSICRVLTLAYILEYIKNNQNFEEFLKYSRHVLGRSEKDEEESGILSSLNIPSDLEILKKPQDDKKLLEWVGKGQSIANCHYNIDKSSVYIPEVQIGIKSGIRSFLKILRDANAEFEPLSDFLRMRLIFKDETSTEDILKILHKLQEDAEEKDLFEYKIEFRSKNYFSQEEENQFFPFMGGEKKGNAGQKKSYYRSAGDNGIKSILIDSNPETGANFRNLSAKIKLFRPDPDNAGIKKQVFAFEIQFLRAKEFEYNEKSNMPSSHFTFELGQALVNASRNSGKMERQEIIEVIKHYLEKNISTESIPPNIMGIRGKPRKEESDVFEIGITGTIDEKAKKLFEFFVETGTLQKVTADFPAKNRPTDKQLEKSIYYMHESVRKNILTAMGYYRKKGGKLSGA
jgi:hypothetical protein